MSSDPRCTPTGIRAPHGARVFEVSWADGSAGKLPHEVLRGYCPCAGCQGHTPGVTFQEDGNLDLRNVAPVGNYALQLTWGDNHGSGLYTFRYLRRLCDLVDEHGPRLLELRPPLANV